MVGVYMNMDSFVSAYGIHNFFSRVSNDDFLFFDSSGRSGLEDTVFYKIQNYWENEDEEDDDEDEENEENDRFVYPEEPTEDEIQEKIIYGFNWLYEEPDDKNR